MYAYEFIYEYGRAFMYIRVCPYVHAYIRKHAHTCVFNYVCVSARMFIMNAQPSRSKRSEPNTRPTHWKLS